MKKTLYYLYDPLCGWCYGATPAVSDLLGASGFAVELLPTGLFSSEGARPMDDHFAAYAWSNDQRIERLTGQRFTEAYRQYVLNDRQQLFDSGPSTVALTAVSLFDPAGELEALKAIQHARYVEGSDVTSLTMLADLVASLGFEQAATKVVHPDANLLAATQARIDQAQTLMQEVNARGVPTLIAESGTKHRLLNVSAAYSNPRTLIDQLKEA